MSQDKNQASLQLLYNISRELAMAIDLRSVLSRVLALSLENVGGERGTIVVFDETGKPVDGAMVFGTRPIECTLEQLNATVEHGLAGWVVRTGKAVLIADTSQDERWLRRPDDTQQRSGPKSAICVPLLARDRLVGVLTIVHSQVCSFKNDQLDLMQTIGGLAGISVENAQLFARVEQVQKRYHDLFEDSIDPILITDLQGKILETNRQASTLSGFPREALASMQVSDLHKIPPEKTGETLHLPADGSTVSYEAELLTKSSVSIPVEVHVHSTRIEGSDYLQWLLRDITERKNLEAMQDDLTAMVYHDLRSPLTNVVSSLDMLRTMLPDRKDTTVNSLLEIADHSTRRMQRLVSSLLDIRHLESGQPISHMELITVDALVRDAATTIQPLINSKQQELELTITPDMPSLQVDVDMIRRVIINLLENACKFTPANGLIQLGVRLKNQEVVVWVKDSGPGIPVEEHEHIFQKFVHLRAEGSPKGLGLGLFFCRLAVNAHGGRIWVESQPPEGSQFNFSLPIADPHLAVQSK